MSGVNLPSPELITTFPNEQLWTIPSWGIWAKFIERVSEKIVLHFSFDSLDPYDSLGNHTLFYVTIAQKTDSQSLVLSHWLMDPVNGDNQFLYSFPSNSTQVFLLATAFAGTSGGPLPVVSLLKKGEGSLPTLNGSLTVVSREVSQSFSFPGYITRYTGTQEILVSSIRYYSIGTYEWTPENTNVWVYFGKTQSISFNH